MNTNHYFCGNCYKIIYKSDIMLYGFIGKAYHKKCGSTNIFSFDPDTRLLDNMPEIH
jgi:hypothetical protein